MSNEEAIQWVDANKGLIIKRAQKFVRYVPYEIDDYVQLAYASAVEAAVVVRRQPGAVFVNIFRSIFNKHVSEITPMSDEALAAAEKRKQEAAAEKGIQRKASGNRSGNACMSFPADLRKDVDIAAVKAQKRSRIDLEKIYREKVADKLSPRENEMMELALGLTVNGVMSEREIAAHMGVSRGTVRTLGQRALSKVTASVVDISKARFNREQKKGGKVFGQNDARNGREQSADREEGYAARRDG